MLINPWYVATEATDVTSAPVWIATPYKKNGALDPVLLKTAWPLSAAAE